MGDLPRPDQDVLSETLWQAQNAHLPADAKAPRLISAAAAAPVPHNIDNTGKVTIPVIPSSSLGANVSSSVSSNHNSYNHQNAAPGSQQLNNNNVKYPGTSSDDQVKVQHHQVGTTVSRKRNEESADVYTSGNTFTNSTNFAGTLPTATNTSSASTVDNIHTSQLQNKKIKVENDSNVSNSHAKSPTGSK